MKTVLFDFELPPDRIAMQPVFPRDASRLLVVKDATLHDRSIRDIPGLLRPGDLMIFNDTKVLPARLTGKRGEVTIEILLHRYQGGRLWRAFARPGKRLKIGDKIIIANEFYGNVRKKHETGEVDIEWNSDNWKENLYIHGKMPLPPYIKNGDEVSDIINYQTIYAQVEGAVAAPTAGLHFTQELFEAITSKGIKTAYITLHVGGGTFLPVKTDNINAHVMHKEYFEISEYVAKTIHKTREDGGRVIAVGTTSLRALESAADVSGKVHPTQKETDIFITPGYRFKVADILLTNFHLPRSTLFMLVSAFAGLETMQNAYHHAIINKYRFYSYGDACLIYPK